jgi:hypothetical protein
MNATKDELKMLLEKHVLVVNFNKTDGSKRTMKCTLLQNIVKPHTKKTEKSKKQNDSVLSVWDLEKEAFRSFKIDSVIDYHVVEEGYEL